VMKSSSLIGKNDGTIGLLVLKDLAGSTVRTLTYG
jgi:hypothetical protein